ncbi:MAG: LamG-like jellyroll fold domain-containing protein, partial [Salibacteraceae bacterium]
MRRILILLFVSTFVSSSISAQTLLLTEDFEDNGNGTDYRANEFDDWTGSSQGNDVWTRSENSNNGPNNNTEHIYSGYVGLDWWCGEDLDANDNPFTGTANDEGFLMVKTIDVSAYQGDSIQLQVYLAGNTGTIKRYRADDYLQLKYAFNGDIATGAIAAGNVPTQANLVTGTYTIFAAFYGTGNSVGTSSALIQDVDLDGVSEGSQGGADSLKNAFAEWTFKFPIGGSDTTLSILFQARTSAGSEEVGIDHIRVFTIPAAGAPLAATITASVDPTCFGGSDGSATVTATDGTSPYTYAWSNFANAAAITGLSAGTYTVTVTDASSSTVTASVTLSNPSAMIASASVGSSLLCFGDANGQVTASQSGGDSPFTYQWNTGGTSASISSLSANTYSVTITDGNGCTDSASVTLTQPVALVASAAVTGNISCNGVSDGQVTASETGGTSPYSYSWNTGSTTAVVSGLGANTYSVTITDANGCTDSASVTLTQPVALVASAAVTGNISCNGLSDGQVTASETGGTSPYSYSWNTGATTAVVSGLGANTYSVTITDANGCTDSASVVLNQPAAISASISSSSNVTVSGASDGSATAAATGGTSPYSFNWSNSATTSTISSLATGTYTVTVTDANGCTDLASVTISEPAGALYFDGSNDYVASFPNLTISGNFTVEGWLNSQASSGAFITFSNSGGIYFSAELSTSNTLLTNFRVPASNSGGRFTSTSNAIVLNQWHHFAAVKETDSMRIYIDGTNIATVVAPETINNSDIALALGFLSPFSQQRYFNGSLDEVRIWDRALCVDELSFNRNCESPQNLTDLLAYYSFNQGLAEGTNTGLDS